MITVKMIMEIVSSIYILFFLREKMISFNPFWDRKVENAKITDFRIISGNSYYKRFHYFAFSVVTTTSQKQYLILRRKDDCIDKQTEILHDGRIAVRKAGIMHFTSPCEKLVLFFALFTMLYSAPGFAAGMNYVIFYISIVIVTCVLMPFFNLKFISFLEKKYDDEISYKEDWDSWSFTHEQLFEPYSKNPLTSVIGIIFAVILVIYLLLLYGLLISY